MHSLFVAETNWREIPKALEAGTVAILPVGSACKEHGLHLPMIYKLNGYVKVLLNNTRWWSGPLSVMVTIQPLRIIRVLQSVMHDF